MTAVVRLVLLGTVTLALVACASYQRAQLPTKATPARTRIALSVTVDRSVVQAAEDNAKFFEEGHTPEEKAAANSREAERARRQAAEAEARELSQRMTALLRSELLDRRIGLPVAPDAEADLVFEGVFRHGEHVLRLDWQLVEPATGAAVAAGQAPGYGVGTDLNPYADAVLAKLLTTDVDRYAKGAGPVVADPGGSLPLEAPLAATDGSRAWAVVIGVETYRDGLTPATHAAADARAFAGYAEKTLGVPAAQIKVLVNERAGRADVASAIEEWLPRNARAPGGKVYVFFSGHGAPDAETGKAYLVPWDADPAYLKTRGYGIEELYAALHGLQNQEIYVFLDACFSGSGDRSVLAAGTRPLVPVKTPAAPTRVISFAAAAARETTGAASDAQHGLFTRHLLAAMAGQADSDGDRNVTLGEVVRHVTEKVTAEARLQNREQTPTLDAPGVDPAKVKLVEALK